MNPKLIQSIKHATSVAAHIVISAAIVYTYILVTQNPNISAQVTALLQHYGMPIGITNVVIAEAYAWLKGKYDQVVPASNTPAN